MKRNLCFAVFVALVLGVPAFAATPAGNGGEIGFGFGQTDVSSGSTGIDTAQFVGVRGGYNINKDWQVEGQFASSSENGSILGTTVDTKMRLYMVNGVMSFHPRKKEFVPYVMAGVGRADVSVDSAGTTASDNAVAYQIGGGTRIYFGQSKRMAFRTDLTLLRQATFNDSSTLTTLTGGITWNLGGR